MSLATLESIRLKPQNTLFHTCMGSVWTRTHTTGRN